MVATIRLYKGMVAYINLQIWEAMNLTFEAMHP